MRPLKLRMTAFGPFVGNTENPVEVDFTALGNEGLYLICGRTGAGKTSIFDAITFALYGEASGNARSDKMLRSKYASPDIPTKVELTFEYRDKTYTITRNPEYERPKARGNGMTKESASVTLTYPDGKILDGKVNDVNNKIKEILGIDRDQFNQIAMISQGDFMKLLHADTKERQKIFREIFKTEKYEKIQKALSDKSKELKDINVNLKKDFGEHIRSIECDNDSIFMPKLEMLKRNDVNISDETDETIKGIIREDTESVTKLSKNLSEIDDKLEKVNKKIGKAEEKSKAEIKLQKVNSDLENIKSEISDFEKILEEKKNKLSEKDTINRKLGEIKNELGKYSELDNLRENVLMLTRSIKTNGDILQKRKINLSSYLEEQEKKKKEQESITDSEFKIKDLENDLANLKKDEDKAINLLENTKTLQKTSSKLEVYQNEYIKAKENYNKSYNAYFKAYESFLDEQAGILAEKLQENTPCPVCGSLVHPHIAVKSDNAVTKEDVDRLEKSYKNDEKEMNDSSNSCSKAKAEHETIKNIIDTELGTAYNNDADYLEYAARKIEGIKKQQRETAEILMAERKKAERKSILSEEIAKYEENIKALTENISKLSEQISADKATYDEKVKQGKELASKLSFHDEKEAKNKISELIGNLEKIQKEYDEAEKNRNILKESENNLKGQQKSLTEQIEKYEVFDLNQLENEKDELIKNKKEISNVNDIIKHRIALNQSSYNKLKEIISKLSEIEKEYTLVKSLSETANGSINGKAKISLETYVQMYFFDKITQMANRRLLLMTNNQYELRRRQTDKAQGNSQNGLELDILDHYNGNIRDVRSLSGGESFKASLSLALGLSDVVQSSAPAIKLDCMFIDEGFGSLDSESLKQAINALSDMSSSGRLVGIISHVDTLKERIEKQIIVTKDMAGGSKIEVKA